MHQSIVTENTVGLALLTLYAKRAKRFIDHPILGPSQNILENQAWRITGVPVAGLTDAVRTNFHVAHAANSVKMALTASLLTLPVGDYSAEDSRTLKFIPEQTAKEWIFSESVLNFEYDASVRLDDTGQKCVSGTIDFTFYDEVDANSFLETHKKGGFGADVPLVIWLINWIEGEADLVLDKAGQ